MNVSGLKRLTAFGIVVALAFVLGVMGHAGSSYALPPGQGFEITPPLKDLKVNPGDVVDFKIQLRNVTNTTVIAKPQIEDFVANGEGGDPKILAENTSAKSPYSLRDWVSNVADTTIKPKVLADINVRITVPANASPGGHYGVIRFTAMPVGLEGSGVSLSTSIGTLVMMNVSGKIVERAEFTELYVSHNDSKGHLFETGPLVIAERLRNTGNVHFKPHGNVLIKNILGREIANLKINESNGNILPASIRKFEQTLNKKNLFGRYSARADILYGDNKYLSQSLTFWVIPYKTIIVGLAVLIGLILLIKLFMRLYKRRILGQSSYYSGGNRKRRR